MRLNFLKSKIHHATVTGADLEYEGSVSIDPALCDRARFYEFEKVEIYNCSNGERFSTYVLMGEPGEICLNGAAARKAHKGDQVIICAYCELEEHEVASFEPTVVILDENNRPKK